MADALTQDVLLAPIESSINPGSSNQGAISRAISSDRIRYLLADEVGLGKTIEAGLIMLEFKLRAGNGYDRIIGQLVKMTQKADKWLIW